MILVFRCATLVYTGCVRFVVYVAPPAARGRRKHFSKQDWTDTMDVNEVFETLIAADAYLTQNIDVPLSESSLRLLDDIPLLVSHLTQYLATLHLVPPALDIAGYRTEIENGRHSGQLREWILQTQKLAGVCCANTVDKAFYGLVHTLRSASASELAEVMRNNYGNWLSGLDEEIRRATIINHNMLKFWGSLNPEAGDYGVVDQRVDCLTNHLGDLVQLYTSLADYRSRKLLYALLMYWVQFDFLPVNLLQERQFDSYFDLDLMHCGPDEVFVDMGCYTGDTVLSYINSYGAENYRRIYSYEIVAEHLEQAKNNLRQYKNIDFRLRGVAEANKTMYLESETPHPGSAICESGQISVQAVALDEDVPEAVTFIKMDLEGGEYNALLGSERHIRQDHPKLAVCLYHSNQDLWRLPKLIHSFGMPYKYYLRFNSTGPQAPNPYPFISDYVLLCVPDKA